MISQMGNYIIPPPAGLSRTRISVWLHLSYDQVYFPTFKNVIIWFKTLIADSENEIQFIVINITVIWQILSFYTSYFFFYTIKSISYLYLLSYLPVFFILLLSLIFSSSSTCEPNDLLDFSFPRNFVENEIFIPSKSLGLWSLNLLLLIHQLIFRKLQRFETWSQSYNGCCVGNA